LTRPGNYGKFLAQWMNYTIETIPSCRRAEYRKSLERELRDYSFEPRREGTPRNSGCAHELEGMEILDISDPEHLGRLIKEGIHLMYQKQTASHVIESLLENLERAT